MPEAAPQRFAQALDVLIEQVQQDRSVLAAILCGSLSHDTVWSKSDIDLLLVTIDDQKVKAAGHALYADGINVHAMLLPRSHFRRLVDGTLHNSFMHSLLAKGRLLYTHDPSIAELYANLQKIGERDTRLQLMAAGIEALLPIYKAHKWLLTRGDFDYTALWILYAATPLARIEVLSARELADREVILHALRLNPGFFGVVYTEMLNGRKTAQSVAAALSNVDRYLAERAPALFAPVLEYLREAGEARSSTEIENHFEKNFGISGVTAACEYLADQGLVGKAGTALQLTKRSSISVEELAFFATEPA